MRGLLVKDYLLLKNQKMYFLSLTIIFTLIAIFTHSPTLIITTLPLFISMFSVSTISYDEFDNGNPFLFTLPFTKKQYVLGKYIFGIGIGIIGVFVAAIILSIMSLFTTVDTGILIVALSSINLLIVFMAFLLPVQLKYGSEKGRLVNLVVIGVIWIVGVIILSISTMLKVDVKGILITIANLNPYVAMLVILIISLMIVYISYRVSIKLFSSKQF